jgi:uncharacterized protein DUF4279
MSEKWSRASLRLVSEVLPPDAISDALGTEFDHSYRLGDQVSPKNSPWVLRNKHGCFLESGLPSDQPLPDHLISLAGKIRPFAMKLVNIRDRVDADVFCGFASSNGQGGFTLTPDLLASFVEWNLPLTLDLYPPEAVDA